LNELDSLAGRLARVGDEIKEIIDQSLELKSRGSSEERQVIKLWEEFLKNFFTYVRNKGRQTRQNLFAGISFGEVFKR